MACTPPRAKHCSTLLACPAEEGATLHLGTVTNDLGADASITVLVIRKGPERRAVLPVTVEAGRASIAWPAILTPGHVYTFALMGAGNTPLPWKPWEYNEDTDARVVATDLVDELSALVEVHRGASSTPQTFTEAWLTLAR